MRMKIYFYIFQRTNREKKILKRIPVAMGERERKRPMPSLAPKIKTTRFISGNLKTHSKEMIRVVRLFLQLERKIDIHKTTSHIRLNTSNKKTKINKILVTKENLREKINSPLILRHANQHTSNILTFNSHL